MNLKLTLALIVIAAVALGLRCAVATGLAQAAGRSNYVVMVNFDVTVDLGSSTMMERAVTTAELLHAKAIVIVMNTPGGYLSDMLKIVNYIEEAQSEGIPVYTYVPPDSMAASAGSYIAMATNSIVMANGTFIGPSTPIVVGGTPLEQNHTEDAMISFMESLAAKWGRNTTAAEIMVVSDKAYTAQQAYQYHLINGLANSLPQAMEMWNLTNYTPVNISENAYEQFLSVLSNSTVDGILITLGFLAILVDLYHPTFLLSAAGIVSIILGLVGAEIIGASAIGLTLVLLGVAIMFLELKTGHGIALMAGAAIAAFGIYLFALGIPYISTSVPTAPKAVLADASIAAVGVAAGLYIRWVVGPLRRRKAVVGPESMIGDVGVALTDVNPVGEVRVQGIVWRAESESGPIRAGERVVVVGRRGLTLIVKRYEGGGNA